VTPDGRVLYAEQTGVIHMIAADDDRLPTPALDISARLDTWWERGLIGMTLHPDFPASPFIYLVYVAKDPCTHHVISRFTMVGNTIDPRSEVVLLEGDDQEKMPGHVKAGHQGGPICFGADGMLYIGIGEQTSGQPSQQLDTLLGKILRIRSDGLIPEDNPFYSRTTGKYRSIFAIGIRNPFGLTLHPQTGQLIETDVGASSFEEINVITAGGNYGWPEAEGMSESNAFINPIHAYPPAIGRSICGAAVYPDHGSFPDIWHGRLFFVDWAAHWIKAIDMDNPESLIDFGSGFESPVAVDVTPDGSLLVLNRNTRWRDGKVFREDAGSLVRIRHIDESLTLVPDAMAPPQSLADTGFFNDLDPIGPAAGFHPLYFNSPVWRPGVRSESWIRIPDEGTVSFAEPGPWQFPKNTVILQHYETLSGLNHETHVYTSNGDGSYRAAAYRWEPHAGPMLVARSGIVPLPVSNGENRENPLKWLSPGPEKSFRPELSVVGFQLPVTTAQLNAGSQLERWAAHGWVEPPDGKSEIADWPRLAAIGDNDSPLERRVRSYLDANCAGCHRPGGPSRGLFDARFSTPLAEQNILNGELMAGDLGIEGARVVVPGRPDQSILLERMKRHDAFRMPPVAVNSVESPAIAAVELWIRSLAP
jgi:glucose/arabinose dehydrogenase/mono/diheme cytochrome c family protein